MTSRSVQSAGSKVGEQLFSARPQDYPSSRSRQDLNYQIDASPRPPRPSEEHLVLGNKHLHEQYGLEGGEDSDPLQLEHMLGFAGDFRRTLSFCPNKPDYYIRSLGSLVAIEKIDDPHSQRFFRGHDMTVSLFSSNLICLIYFIV